MGTKADGETGTILRKLSIFLPAFYCIYYLLSIILVGGFHVGWKHLGRYPFRIRTNDFSPAEGSAALGAWLAMVLTYFVSISLTYGVVRATRRAWDYVATTSLIHLIICIAVNQAFPINWIWWLTILLCVGCLSLASEVVNYYLVDLREIKLDNV